jgi:hypothetical protein
MNLLKAPNKVKPDYITIVSRAGKEFAAGVKWIINKQNLHRLERVYHLENALSFDVVLLTRSRLLVCRIYKGEKQAHFQEFKKYFWDEHVNQDKPNLDEFFRLYDFELDQLEEKWLRGSK